MKLGLAIMAAAITVAAAPANAVTGIAYRFDTTGNTAQDGTYGNVDLFQTANKPSTLQMSVTAWQASLSTGAISSAYLGAYGGGLGVTGIGDAHGAGGLHQIDSAGGYVDFLLLEFNEAVTLASIKTNSYGINGVYANAALWGDASAFVSSSWNSTAGFASSFTPPANAGIVADANSFGWRLTGATTASTKWLVAASPFQANDGFKLASVTVAEQVAAVAPVPEPATWLTMILGFGLAGFGLRRARRSTGRTPAPALA